MPISECIISAFFDILVGKVNARASSAFRRKLGGTMHAEQLVI